MSQDSKVCKTCKKEKPVSEFGRNKYAKDLLNFYCKTCVNKYQQIRAQHFVIIGR